MAGTAPDAAASLDPDLTMMARDSASLTALAAALAEQPGAPPPPEGPAEALAWPVAGTVLNHFDEPDAARVRRPGLVVGAPPLALVTAPADAVVRYAGPFLEYGYVVVLEPDSETMVVLAGLARLRVATGQRVLRGEFLGLMGGHAPDVEEYVMSPEADTGAGGGETLYIEVRHGRGPVDPEPLFAGDKRIGTLDEEDLDGRDRWCRGGRGGEHAVRGADSGAGGRRGEVGLRAARSFRRHLRAHPHLLCRAGGGQGADRGGDQRHADAPRPAFELHAVGRVRRHAGADQGRVRRPRHRGDAGERLREGGLADRRHAGRPSGRAAGRPHHRGGRRERERADAGRGGGPDARPGRLGHHHHADPRGHARTRST